MNREESVIEDDLIASNSNGEVSAETIATDLFARERSPEPLSEVVEPIAEPTQRAEAVEAEETPSEPKPKAKRKSRAISGRSRRKAAVEPGPTPKVTAEPSPADPVVVVRTGSTDRHLIEDEPAFPQPVRRPKSVRDLDHIPDDFD